MSRISRTRKDELRLFALQGEFEQLLTACLKEAAERDRWGLFGQLDNHPESHWLAWPEAEKVRSLSQQIITLRSELMKTDPYPPLDRFVYYSALRGPNAKGEPRLAEKLLAELNAS